MEMGLIIYGKFLMVEYNKIVTFIVWIE